MPKILITGANSFVGYNFRKFSRYSDIEEISLLETSPDDIDYTRFDLVLHLAAIVHQKKKIPESEYFKVNKDLALQVAEMSRKGGIKQFIFLSTIKVYGDHLPVSKLWDEQSECFPDSAYGRSKLEAENELIKLDTENFTVSIVRTPLVYGEGVKANMVSFIKLVETLPFLPFKNMTNRRNFTYTGNLVGFIDQIILKRASGIFIAMDSEAISTGDLVNYLSKYLEKKVILFHLPDIIVRLGFSIIPGVFGRLFGSLEFDNRRTLEKLNFKPSISTEEGIKMMVASYKKRKKDK